MNDEELIASYLDRGLDKATLRSFESRLAVDPALAARVSDARSNDALIRRGFTDLGPVPDRLLAAVLDNDALRSTASSAPVDLAAERMRRQQPNLAPRRSAIPAWAAVAASLVIGVAMVSRFVVQSAPTLETALATAASGSSVELAGHEKLTPVLTVATNDGRYCREFAIDGPGGRREGVACGGGSGWTVEQIERSAGSGSNGGYQEAAGPGHPDFEAIYRRVGASDPLSPSDEHAAIRRDWTLAN